MVPEAGLEPARPVKNPGFLVLCVCHFATPATFDLQLLTTILKLPFDARASGCAGVMA